MSGKASGGSGPKESGSVWVFIEQERGAVNSVSWELLGAGRELADQLKAPLAAVVLGHEIGSVAADCSAYGADDVYVVDDPVLADYRTHPYCRALSSLVRQYHPEILLIGATSLGRDLASPVATELETGLTADCTQLEVKAESGLLEQTRPAFGGNVMATILCKESRPQMATVRPRVFSAPEYDDGRSAKIIEVEGGVAEEEVPTRILEFVASAQEDDSDIGKAEVIVSGGRGLGGPGNVELIEELAAALGGEAGGSRPLIDMGWLPPSRQVGQTGKTVRPKLYVAVGISGAVQHLAGMRNSDVIVAINSDPEAPIFDVAHYGVVGDLFEIVPILIKRLIKPKDTAEPTPVPEANSL